MTRFDPAAPPASTDTSTDLSTGTANPPAPPLTDDDLTILDNPAWYSLTGGHADLAEVRGRARRYPVDVSPFTALPDDADEAAWADLAALVGPGGSIALTGPAVPPPDWTVEWAGEGVQLVDAGVDAAPDPQAVRLGLDDVPEMLDLVARTKPGPFLPRTVVMGTYLGVRHNGRLVAMAGQRLHPTGWTEISAVCTDAEHRGEGLATRLVLAVAADIRERGETPLMHAAGSNTNAIALYQHLGFHLRRYRRFGAYQPPEPQ